MPNENVLFQNRDVFLSNIDCFIIRFPELSKSMHLNSDTITTLKKNIPESYKLERSKYDEGNVLTANINGKYIHSKYDPLREAEKILTSDFFSKRDVKTECVFYGLGLGYLIELYAKKNPNANLIIVEPDIFIFLLFLSSRDLSSFFNHSKITILLGAYPNEVLDFFSATNQDRIPVFKQPILMDISSDWFRELEVLHNRRKQKDNLNKNTLKKFGKLWLKNFFKNINRIQGLQGIKKLENTFYNESAIIIAAGPSLTEHLKIIKTICHKFILIATDTSVRACLREQIIPDFIILLDSQYWNYLHLSDLNIGRSILITESSVYPAVFRMKTKHTLLCTSNFPLAQYIENLIDEKGKIITGGSVATAAWDFARILGCSKLIMAGLDLAFPNFQTHFLGSRFEESSNSNSDRFLPTETSSHRSLYSAFPEVSDGYKNKVLTDKRMKMYAWWFESKIEQFPNIKTYNLEPKGLKIPNMQYLSKNDFFRLSENSKLNKQKKDLYINKVLNSKKNDLKTKNLYKALNSLIKDLEDVKIKTDNAMELTKLLKSTSKDINTIKTKLNKIDFELRENKANTIIGFDLLIDQDTTDDIYKLINENVCYMLNIIYKNQKNLLF